MVIYNYRQEQLVDTDESKENEEFNCIYCGKNVPYYSMNKDNIVRKNVVLFQEGEHRHMVCAHRECYFNNLNRR